MDLPVEKLEQALSTSSGRTPDLPTTSEFALRRSIARTTSSSSGSPTPVQQLTTRFRCSRFTSSAAIAMELNLPKPVFTP